MVKEIPLSKGYVALVDDEDYKRVSKYKWHAHSGKGPVYAAAWIPGYTSCGRVRMHRFILWGELAKHPGFVVDHINHNTLDNRRCNLRLVTLSQNCGNRLLKAHSSRFKGVFWDSVRGKWHAQLKVSVGRYEYKKLFLGRFSCEEDAALAYNKAALAYYGSCALLNPV